MKIKFTEFHLLLAAGIIILISGTAFLYWISKLENLPTFFVTIITLGFSYLAYYNAREKFRLELFEKRLESYINFYDVCELIVSYGKIPDPKDYPKDHDVLTKAASKSIIGDGRHLTYFLFGDDVKSKYVEVSEIYERLKSRSVKYDVHGNISKTDDEENTKDIVRVFQIQRLLPELFSKYLNMKSHYQR